MDSNRVKAGKHSWVHLGMDFGHGFVMDLAWIWGMIHGLESSQSCMDFGGIVRGGFWQDFEVNDWQEFGRYFEIIFGK
mgnify:CR=1 FL=1